MMLGMESCTGGMLEADVAVLVQDVQQGSGDQFLQWRAERRHQAVTRQCGTTAVQSHAALMSRHTVYSHT